MAASSLLPQIVTAPTSATAGVKVRNGISQLAAPVEIGQPQSLRGYYDALFAAHGPQHWWPGRTRFEIIVGAILTQNTSWKNVERAISNLRRAKLLSPSAIRNVSPVELAKALRPSGYYRQKSKTLRTFVEFLYDHHGGSLSRLFRTSTEVLRQQLLRLRGIGPETADSILLYAGKHAVFVVDAYTRRMFERHGLIVPTSTYEEIRTKFESALSGNQKIFNEFHALIVHTGKHFCRKTDPACSVCPLKSFLPSASKLLSSGNS